MTPPPCATRNGTPSPCRVAPNNPAAVAGLKRAEKWMNGLDPSEDDGDDLEDDDLVSD